MSIRAAALTLCIAVAALPAQQPPAPTISKFDRGVSLTMLHQVKADLKDNYYDKTLRGMDVEKTFQAAEERLKAAGSVNQSIAIIADVLMGLQDSHTVFIPPDRRARVIYGWQAAMIGDEPYVVDVRAGSDAEKKGLARGDRILAWNRFEVNRQNLWQIYYLYNFVRPQQTQIISVRKPDGSERTIDVESDVEERQSMDLEDLLDAMVSAATRISDRDTLVGSTMVWRYSAFLDPAAADKAMKKARGATGLVLDLRGNGGGSIEAMRRLASRLFDRDVHIATERTRKGDKALDVKGRKDAFGGKIVVLVDSLSGSASEITARLMQIEKRGTVIGDRTAGAVMTARIFPHAVGVGTFAFYATTITVGDLRMSDGASLEHQGVTPDELLLPTAADLAAGRDPVLARAVTLLGGTLSAEEAGKLFTAHAQ